MYHPKVGNLHPLQVLNTRVQESHSNKLGLESLSVGSDFKVSVMMVDEKRGSKIGRNEGQEVDTKDVEWGSGNEISQLGLLTVVPWITQFSCLS